MLAQRSKPLVNLINQVRPRYLIARHNSTNSQSTAGEKVDWSKLASEIEMKNTSSVENETVSDTNLDSVAEVFSQPKHDLKDKMAFSQIFDSILNKSETKGTSRPVEQAKPSMSSMLHDLFESNSAATNTVSSATTLPQGFVKPGPANPKAAAEEDALSAQIKPYVDTVFKHIDGLESSSDIVDYYLNVVVPAYSNTAALESVDPSSITAETPFVNTKTSPALLCYCLDTLINDFKDPSGAFHLFEQVKHRGMDVYAGTCDATVYNRMIALRWDYYLDIHATTDVVSEMFLNAVYGNADTASLLDRITTAAIEFKRGTNTAINLPLWTKENDLHVTRLIKYRSRILESLSAKSGIHRLGFKF